MAKPYFLYHYGFSKSLLKTSKNIKTFNQNVTQSFGNYVSVREKHVQILRVAQLNLSSFDLGHIFRIGMKTKLKKIKYTNKIYLFRKYSTKSIF